MHPPGRNGDVYLRGMPPLESEHQPTKKDGVCGTNSSDIANMGVVSTAEVGR